MLEQYKRIIESYKTWYPIMYKQTVDCRPSGRYTILVTLEDGTRIEYNSFDNTIKDVTKFYIHDSEENVDEEQWRKEFGRKLRLAITNRGISQEKVADRVGISRQMMTRYVRGSSTPSGYILSKLSEILDCDVRELTRFGYIDE